MAQSTFQCQKGERESKVEDQKTNSETTGRVPSYCSATCTCMNCVQDAIKKRDPEKKTSDYFACKLPRKFEHPHWFNGYGSQVNKQHPFYRTTASEYGWYPPGICSVPSVYMPLNQAFTSHLYSTGMYRNYSLNMSAPDPPTKMCIHSVPSQYFPARHSFTSQLAAAGMYRNYSLNTKIDC